MNHIIWRITLHVLLGGSFFGIGASMVLGFQSLNNKTQDGKFWDKVLKYAQGYFRAWVVSIIVFLVTAIILFM